MFIQSCGGLNMIQHDPLPGPFPEDSRIVRYFPISLSKVRQDFVPVGFRDGIEPHSEAS